MKKSEYFIKAVKEKLYAKKAFIISAFSIIKEDLNAYKKDPYPYRLVQTSTGCFFVDPNSNNQLTQIEDAIPNTPLLRFQEELSVPAKTIANLDTDIVTTYGILFVNACCLAHNFGSKIKYLATQKEVFDLENIIAPRLENTPKPNQVREDKYIYVDEYVRFVDSLLYLTGFTQLCVWAATEKTISPPPGIEKIKAQLLLQFKDKLTDPSVLAGIEKELVAFDAAYLKGDPGENFLLSKKLRETSRKILFLMQGGEASMGSSGNTVKLIQNSLLEGWEIDKFPEMNDSLRTKAYNRGAETQLGGEATKWLFRASSNLKITVPDCGTKIGKDFDVTEQNRNKLVGYSVLVNGETIAVETKEQAGTYLGKTLMVRSPLYCKLTYTDFCSTCVGANLAQTTTGLSLAIAAYGSSMMLISLKSAHSSGVKTQKLNIKEVLY